MTKKEPTAAPSISLSVDDANAIVAYLASRPYREVHHLIPLLVNAKVENVNAG